MVSKTNKNYYIAETAFHHEGDIEFLINLINDVVKLDIDAIKFHLLFDLNDYMVSNHSAIDVLNRICISKSEWENIFNIVKDSDKEIIALTNDIASLQYINKIQNNFPIEAIEIHSTGLNDLFLLQEATKFNKTVILGVGGSTLDEIKFVVDFLRNNGKEKILLMHGFQNYPTAYEDINFKRIPFLKEAFNLPLGYTDHTDPSDQNNTTLSVLPAMYGVKVFEKHVTNVPFEKRIDAQAAISLDQMRDVISKGEMISKSLGQETILFSEAELNYGDTGPMKKAIVARHDISKGTVLSLEHVAYKRTEDSSPILQKDIYKLLGSKVIEPLKKDELITFSKIKYQFKKQSNEQFFIKK